MSGRTSGVTATKASVPGLYVGTSGWSYPSWRPGFYPADVKPPDFLRYYSERFPSVELNTTGYRLPAEEQFRRWGKQTPPGFRFAVKLNAHQVRQAATFEERVRQLGDDRLGPIRVVVGSARDEGLLTLTLGSFDPALPIAFDFRHDSWAGIEADLPPNAVRVGDLESKAPFRYLRLREPPYDESALAGWADCIRPLLTEGIEVYIFFEHEEEPSAPQYAERLLKLTSG
ncbi:MAG: DUF72 domain-containing protein [Actinobacteria bacterium]|nr:MAG: DUF72 domain-containing protein [Actinomycetota bacterium]